MNHTTSNFIKEACVETLAQCVLAQAQGADRLEICADLELDGLTPAGSLIDSAREVVQIPIRVMIRPRSGGFWYSDEEFSEMKRSIILCKELNVEGVVFGITNKEGSSLDIEKIHELAEFAEPLKVTVHKAIDSCADPVSELQKLIKLGNVHSVLTSGKAPTAMEGKEMLRQMLALALDSIEVIACGKVTNENIQVLDQELHASAYHGKLIVGYLS